MLFPVSIINVQIPHIAHPFSRDVTIAGAGGCDESLGSRLPIRLSVFCRVRKALHWPRDSIRFLLLIMQTRYQIYADHKTSQTQTDTLETCRLRREGRRLDIWPIFMNLRCHVQSWTAIRLLFILYNNLFNWHNNNNCDQVP